MPDPRGRSVPELPFRTLWNREDYGCVTVAQGVPQRDESVTLGCPASRTGHVQDAFQRGGSVPPRLIGSGRQRGCASSACVIRVPLFMGVKPALRYASQGAR